MSQAEAYAQADLGDGSEVNMKMLLVITVLPDRSQALWAHVWALMGHGPWGLSKHWESERERERERDLRE